jgi:hypothetical protein
MRLIINGATIGIAQMGPDYVYIDCPADYPPGEAEIFLKVDDSERRWKVRLPDGISKSTHRVALAVSE